MRNNTYNKLTVVIFTLRYDRIENDMHNPIAVQVGGSEIDDLKKCAKIAKQYNYDEINLNVGCPSKAVQKGSFGACLMKNNGSIDRKHT